MSQETSGPVEGDVILPKTGLWDLTVKSEIQALADLTILDFTIGSPPSNALSGFVEDSVSSPATQVSFTASVASPSEVVTFTVTIDDCTYTFTGTLNSAGDEIKDGTITSTGCSKDGDPNDGDTDDGTWSATAQGPYPPLY